MTNCVPSAVSPSDVLHAEGEQEHSLCGMAFDAYSSGDAEEEIIFAKPGETVTCADCKRHIDFVRKHYKGYRYKV